MKTLFEIRAALASIATELAELADDRGIGRDHQLFLVAASTHCACASRIADAVDDAMRAAAVDALSELCRCGHDKGDHLVAANAPGGACEHTSEEGSEEGTTLVDPCPCRAFESTVRRLPAKRDTLPAADGSPTERPAELVPAQ